ncbi:MAG: TonB-dependent receptor [Deltaproteobacteria bacterium]|jgi:outer membrane receptor for ferrienterochelin and colicins|nr:TonB-dependent receptor [Deltaproteobacteria bacterium]MDL1987717.1 TonB-dependent receptor [Deltaproteobacteria bacterium]
MIKQTTSAKYQQLSMIAGIFDYMGKGISTIVAVIVVVLAASVAFAGDDEAEKKGTTRLKDIVVTGTRTPHALKDVPVETVLINREDIERTNAQNAMDVLKNIPGIDSSVHDDVFGIYTWRAKLRGLNFNDGYGLILIDGQRAMGCGQSGGMGEYGTGLNQIPVDMIERIEVVKGPSSALYGSDAMAGVINIITKKIPKKATGSAGVSYGWYKIKEKKSNSGTITKPSDDGQSRNFSKNYVSFGDKISDRFGYLLHYNYDGAEDIGQDPIKSNRHSFMGKLDADLSETIDLYLKYEVSDYEKADSREEESYRVSAGIDFRPTDNHFFSLKGYTYTWDFTHGYPGFSYGYKHGDVGYNQGEVQYTWYSSDWNALTLGGEVQEQCIDYVIENADGSMVNVKENVDTSSLYVQDEITLFKAFTLVGGFRYDDHSTFGSKVNPKLSLMYKFSEDTTLRASAGKAFKSPTLRQLYYDTPYRHGDYYCKSNPDLQPEKAIGYSASIEQWLFDQSIMINLGYFRNDVDDMVIREDTGTMYNSLPLKEYRNVEEAWTQGVEFMCRTYTAEGLSAALSYTYTDSENKETSKELTYTPKHVLSILPAYELKKYGLGTSATVSYIGKQYTNSDNTDEIDAHTVVDAKIYKNLSDKAKLSFEADNIFDSDKGDEGNFRTGRTFTVKLDVSF